MTSVTLKYSPSANLRCKRNTLTDDVRGCRFAYWQGRAIILSFPHCTVVTMSERNLLYAPNGVIFLDFFQKNLWTLRNESVFIYEVFRRFLKQGEWVSVVSRRRCKEGSFDCRASCHGIHHGCQRDHVSTNQSPDWGKRSRHSPSRAGVFWRRWRSARLLHC